MRLAVARDYCPPIIAKYEREWKECALLLVGKEREKDRGLYT